MLFAIPMCALYFVGVGAGMVLVLRREGRKIPWQTMILIAISLLVVGGIIAFAMIHFHIHFMSKWPYLTR
jgi:sec-independent protein translocase protein TatC